MAVRRKKACCSACAAGRKCGSRVVGRYASRVEKKYKAAIDAQRKRALRALPPISQMSNAELRFFTSRDPKRLRGMSLRRWMSAKIRLLRHEGYPQAQAIAIAYRMAGVARPRTTTRRSAPKRRARRRS